MSSSPSRRSSFRESPLSYVEVGASEVPDLLDFPPNGARPFFEERKLGTGSSRFGVAASELLTFAAHARAGFTVGEQTQGESPAVGYSRDGRDSEHEQLFGPDGEPYVTPGTTVRLTRPDGIERDMLVIHVIHTDSEVGFVLGTVDSNGVSGEVRYAVELRDDNAVWATARGFFHKKEGRILGGGAKRAVRACVSVLDSLVPPGFVG